MNPQSHAFFIAESFLERTGQATQRGDFDNFRSCFELPHLIATQEGSRWLRSAADLREIFEAVRTRHALLGDAYMVRRCTGACFLAPDEILTCHESRVIANNQIMNKPMPAASTLQLVDGMWRITKSSYGLDCSDMVGHAMLFGGTAPCSDEAAFDAGLLAQARAKAMLASHTHWTQL